MTKTYTVKKLIARLAEINEVSPNALVYVDASKARSYCKVVAFGSQYVTKKNRVRRSYTKKVRRVILLA